VFQVRAIVQRVTSARVLVGERVNGEIGRGLLVLVGVGRDDTTADVKALAAKICDVRVFEGDGKPMDRSVVDVGGSLLVVSQFTLYGDVRQGRRPAFTGALEPVAARELYERSLPALRASGVLRVEAGEFAADMKVELVNDGPVTILLDSRKLF
jgi:D-aminoacyl-tRNA deacylase